MQKMLSFDKSGETIDVGQEIQNENYGSRKVEISLFHLSVNDSCHIIRFLRGGKK